MQNLVGQTGINLGKNLDNIKRNSQKSFGASET
jgi:hypothetical protein